MSAIPDTTLSFHDRMARIAKPVTHDPAVERDRALAILDLIPNPPSNMRWDCPNCDHVAMIGAQAAGHARDEGHELPQLGDLPPPDPSEALHEELRLRTRELRDAKAIAEVLFWTLESVDPSAEMNATVNRLRRKLYELGVGLNDGPQD